MDQKQQDNSRSDLLVNVGAELAKTTLLTHILVFVHRAALVDVLLTDSGRVVGSGDKRRVGNALVVRVL
jgi:hypothetical protein